MQSPIDVSSTHRVARERVACRASVVLILAAMIALLVSADANESKQLGPTAEASRHC